ncbi:MAG: hypothetical protein U1F57_01475 [bacterium]
MKKLSRLFIFWALVAVCLPFSGILSCGVPKNIIGNQGAILFVLDEANDAVYIYDNATTLNGTLVPNRTLSGATNTGISSPTTVAVDSIRDILYVSDSTNQDVLAFIPASTVNGDVAPTRKYPGVKKGGAAFYDETNDRLYITDVTDKAVKVWDKISTLQDGTANNRTIKFNFEPAGMMVDTQRDFLYVGDPSTASVQVFPNASTSSGNPTAVRTIKDSSQAFVNLSGLDMNILNDILFVSDSGIKSVEMFDQTSTLNGTVAATRELDGANTQLGVNQGELHFLNNSLFVNISDTQIAVWDSANQLTGDVVANRTVTVSPASNIISFALKPGD